MSGSFTCLLVARAVHGLGSAAIAVAGMGRFVPLVMLVREGASFKDGFCENVQILCLTSALLSMSVWLAWLGDWSGSICLTISVFLSIALLFPDEAERAQVMGHVLGGIALGVLIGHHPPPHDAIFEQQAIPMGESRTPSWVPIFLSFSSPYLLSCCS